MARFIKTYSDTNEYEADKAFMEAPHVGYIEDTEEVKYINDMADLYDIYGTVTDGTSSMTITINNTNRTTTVSGGNFMYNWNGGTITSLESAFYGKPIINLNKLSLDTSSVTDMYQMFFNSSKISEFSLKYPSCA